MEGNAQFSCNIDDITFLEQVTAGFSDFNAVDPGAVGTAAIFNVVLPILTPDIDVLSGYIGNTIMRYELLEVISAERPGIACQKYFTDVRHDELCRRSIDKRRGRR